MDNSNSIGEFDLAKLAEKEYPYPDKACTFVKAKINWLRKRWIQERLASSDNKPNHS